MASGVAREKPASLTVNWMALTRAALARPPPTKYAVITRAPIRQPVECETPPAILRTAAIPFSCAHKTHSVPTQIRPAARPRTVRPYRSSRKSPTVNRLCCLATRQMRGPIQKASTNDPRPALPFHHHADNPWWYARSVAPTVEPAPMLGARNVAKIRPVPSDRPLTKKSPVLRTRRLIQAPTPIKAME
jgi:hypothetical protein